MLLQQLRKGSDRLNLYKEAHPQHSVLSLTIKKDIMDALCISKMNHPFISAQFLIFFNCGPHTMIEHYLHTAGLAPTSKDRR